MSRGSRLLHGLDRSFRRHKTQSELLQQRGFARFGTHADFGPRAPVERQGRQLEPRAMAGQCVEEMICGGVVAEIHRTPQSGHRGEEDKAIEVIFARQLVELPSRRDFDFHRVEEIRDVETPNLAKPIDAGGVNDATQRAAALPQLGKQGFQPATIADVDGAWLHFCANCFDRMDGLYGGAAGIVLTQRIPRIAWWKALPTEEHNVTGASLSEPAGASQAEPAQATGDKVGARGAQR